MQFLLEGYFTEAVAELQLQQGGNKSGNFCYHIHQLFKLCSLLSLWPDLTLFHLIIGFICILVSYRSQF